MIFARNGWNIRAAVEIAEMSLRMEPISCLKKQDGRGPSRMTSENRSPETMPVIVLADRSTASRAEILAGALQDNDRALIVGERTFGKVLSKT